jgi:hypothetical protein
MYRNGTTLAFALVVRAGCFVVSVAADAPLI